MQNLSQISGPVCPQLFDLASFLWTIAFDKAEPTVEQEIFFQIARFRKNRSLHTSQGTSDWNLRIQLRKGKNYENCLSYFKCSLHKLLFVFSPHFMMVRKNPFKKLEYHVVSHTDIEIFSVENNRLTNVLLTDAANILSTASERIWFANVSVLELGSSI